MAGAASASDGTGVSAAVRGCGDLAGGQSFLPFGLSTKETRATVPA
jgi:hypothetical protein